MTSAFLIELAWKSALISAAALILARLLRTRTAAERAAVLRTAIVVLALLPPVALLLPGLRIEAWQAAAPVLSATLPVASAYGLPMAASPAPPGVGIDAAMLLLGIWASGTAIVIGRLLAGLCTLRRWTHGANPVSDPVWLAALARIAGAAGARRSLRLLVSREVPAPLGWGLRQPTILIGRAALRKSDEAEAILAHEIAHIVRHDWPALLLARITVAVFWFNPLVWLLEREALQQAEEASDAYAVCSVEPIAYAQTLLRWASPTSIRIPANGMAVGVRALDRRIRAVLAHGLRERRAGAIRTLVAMLACVGAVAPVAAIDLVEAAPGKGVGRASFAADVSLVPEVALFASSPAVDADRQAAPSSSAESDVPAAPAPGEPRGEWASDLQASLAGIPAIVASALESAGIDSGEIARAARSEGATIPNTRSRIALAHARESVNAERIRAQVRHSLARGAAGMLRGADGMERGAGRMEEAAARLRDPVYREQVIARQRAEGRVVTHEELIEAAEGMEAGAKGMRSGAVRMREGARRMGEEGQ